MNPDQHDGKPPSKEDRKAFMDLVLAGLGTLVLFYIVMNAYWAQRSEAPQSRAEQEQAQ